MKNIKKIDLTNPEGWSKKSYESRRLEYIAEYKTYVPGGLFSIGYDKPNPAVGEAKWNSFYPKGYESWLQGKGINPQWIIQDLGQKVNELVIAVNKLQGTSAKGKD